jgi:hypothetical protein
MGVSDILASVDREIAILKQVRELLTGAETIAPKKLGRPKKQDAALVVTQEPAKKTAKKKKRKLSPEGRKRIAEAVKRRWEAHRKAAGFSK